MTQTSPEAAQKEVARFVRSTLAIINIIFVVLPLASGSTRRNSAASRRAWRM